MISDKEKNFISAVVYVHNNEDEIEYFLKSINEKLASNFEKYEIICVNDYSTDDTVKIINNISKEFQNTTVNIINMSYKQGLEKSMLAGVDFAIGDFVFEFDSDRVTIYDPNQENSEEVYYTSTVLNLPEPYRTSFNLDDIKKTLDSCAESYITLNFGNEEAITIARNKLINVIQEIRD